MYNKTDIYNIIDETTNDLTLNQYESICKAYNDAMKEKVNQEKTLLEQKSMITDFIDEVRQGGSLSKTLHRYEGNKFFNNISNILGEKIGSDLRDLLDEYNLETDFVTGWKLTTSNAGAREVKDFETQDGRKGKIITKFEDGSKYKIENFNIILEGKLIYNYRRNLFAEFEIDEDIEGYEEKLINKLDYINERLELYREKREQENMNKGKSYKSTHKENYSNIDITDDGKYKPIFIEKRISNNGRTFYINLETKKFASLEDLEKVGIKKEEF